ncbi:hypothetical protein NDU88_006461, partial [Pleurodeles waltl]
VPSMAPQVLSVGSLRFPLLAPSGSLCWLPQVHSVASQVPSMAPQVPSVGHSASLCGPLRFPLCPLRFPQWPL